jgi:uncharacterized membrane protein
MQEDWMLKVGAFLLLLGFAWLTTYAFMNNWIGPVGRISLGVGAGAVLMAFGYHRMAAYVRQGSIFLVLGSAVTILTLFAARAVYGFFSPVSALSIMFLAAAFVALASVHYKQRGMATLSIILAGLTPFLVGSGSLSAVSVFLYLGVIVLGSVWVAALTGWREVPFTALCLVIIYSIPHWAFGRGDSAATLLALAYGFAGLFFVVGVLAVLKSKQEEMKTDLLMAAVNGIFLLIWIMVDAPTEWQGMIMAAWAVVFAVGGFMVFMTSKNTAAFLLYGGVAVGFIGAATAAELSGSALVIAFILEAAALTVLTKLLTKDLRTAESAAALFIIPMALSVQSVVQPWQSVLQADFAVLAVMALALFAVGLYIYSQRNTASVSPKMHLFLLAAGAVYTYILLWRSLHAGMPALYATSVALVLYTVIGLVSHFHGKFSGNSGVQLHGSVLLGFVVLRLLLVDIWSMEISARIVIFFLVGALLMATAFIGRKKKVTTTL